MSERSELHISGRVKKSKDFSIFFNQITRPVGAERGGYQYENIREGAGGPHSYIFILMFAERTADGAADTAQKTDPTAFCARRCAGRAEGMPERRRAQQQEDILIPQRGRCPSGAREGEKRWRGKAAERGNERQASPTEQ